MRILPITTIQTQKQNKNPNNKSNSDPNFNALIHLQDGLSIWFKDLRAPIIWQDRITPMLLFTHPFERRNGGRYVAELNKATIEEARKLVLQSETPSIEVDLRPHVKVTYPDTDGGF